MNRFFILNLLLLAGLPWISSCGDSKKDGLQDAQKPLNTPLGKIAVISAPRPYGVRGFGVVAGLWGTGSAECPPELKKQLEKYIWQRMPSKETFDARKFLESGDTAVVEIFGQIPALATKDQRFDLKIRPLSQSQTTSLRGGILYAADLKEIGRMQTFDQYARTVANAEGSIFTDDSDPNEQYYVLGGGTSIRSTQLLIVLNDANYYVASAVRNLINERFGSGTANALSRSEIQISIPRLYQGRKERFVKMLAFLYLSDTEQQRTAYVDSILADFKEGKNLADCELSLEVVGKTVADKIVPLLDSDSQQICFYAASCLTHIGDSRGVKTLQAIARDKKSTLRIDAVSTMGFAPASLVESALGSLLTDDDTAVRLAAYEQLVQMDSFQVKAIPVGKSFIIDLISCPGPKLIYAYRKDSPRIAIFGDPVQCRKNIFVDQGNVIVNSKAGDSTISITRRHPGRPRIIGPLKTNYSLTELIRTLGHDPETDPKKSGWPGLGIGYSEILDILKTMCENDMIPARFQTSPLTTAGGFLEKQKTETPAAAGKK